MSEPKRKEVDRAIGELRRLTGDNTLEAVYNTAWKGYNVTSKDMTNNLPLGMQTFKADELISGARLAVKALSWRNQISCQ